MTTSMSGRKIGDIMDDVRRSRRISRRRRRLETDTNVQTSEAYYVCVDLGRRAAADRRRLDRRRPTTRRAAAAASAGGCERFSTR